MEKLLDYLNDRQLEANTLEGAEKARDNLVDSITTGVLK